MGLDWIHNLYSPPTSEGNCRRRSRNASPMGEKQSVVVQVNFESKGLKPGDHI
jgi:hypothetical protein